MQKNLSSDIQELMSRPNYKWDTMNINVTNAVTGYTPFTYRGSNGITTKTIIAVTPVMPDNSTNWIFSVDIRRNGEYDMIDVYANGSGTIPVSYIYIDR